MSKRAGRTDMCPTQMLDKGMSEMVRLCAHLRSHVTQIHTLTPGGHLNFLFDVQVFMTRTTAEQAVAFSLFVISFATILTHMCSN